MRLLIDTNILLEIILEQEKADEARALLSRTDEHWLCMSDFGLHSIGLLLVRRKQPDIFRQFVQDVIVDGGVAVSSLAAEDMESVLEASEKFNLDFDDAYQYAAAGKHGLILVSFDADFDRTQRGRRTPSQILGS